MTIKISSSPIPDISSSTKQPATLVEEQSNKKERKRFRRTKQKMEYELDEIFRRLCNGESDFQIMTTLNLQERNYYKYKKKLEARLMEYQLKKTDDTIFMESHLFKNRMLTLYKGLEDVVLSPDKNVTGSDRSKCAEVAASIATNIIRIESEGIKAIKHLGLAGAETAIITKRNNASSLNNNLRNDNDKYDDEYGPDINSHNQQQLEEDDKNRKF